MSVEVEGFDKLYKRLGLLRNKHPRNVKFILESAGGSGVDYMQERIYTYETKWGQHRQSQGRPEAGRIESERFLDSVGMKRVGKGSIEIGYIDNPPSYARYQEFDSYTISGKLEALAGAYDVVRSEIRELKKSYRV